MNSSNLNLNVLAILVWLKEQKSPGWASLDAAALRFGVTSDEMRAQFKELQRYEVVKRGGRGLQEWAITDQGIVRLAEGRFTPTGDFLSIFEQMANPTVTAPVLPPDVTMITVPLDPVLVRPEVEEEIPSTNPVAWPAGFFNELTSGR
ncbi:MAG TPA: hypothetical protein VKT80_02360 [Chloroflexota bacterium]|nr:hypothetical protein [Chloroflexota bacterium]